MNALRSLCLAAAAATAIPAHAATTIISDDFESYADTTALGAEWSLGDGTLDGGAGNPGQSLAHPGTGASFGGGNTNARNFTPILPAAGEIIVFSADIFDDAASANKRVTAGLRFSGGSNILELGMYNAPSHYAYRTVLFAGGDTNWVAFPGLVDDSGSPIDNEPVAGWHRYRAEISDSEITVSLDLNSDGNINASATIPITLDAAGFDIVRLGGPSDLSSAGGGAGFDNVSLEIVPEPTGAALLLTGAGVLALRRRRRG